MIKEIKLKNFKCFEEISVEMDYLNLFAGINSMGKSTVIQAILLLRQAYESNCLDKGIYLNGEYISLGNGYDVLFRDSKEDYFLIEVSADDNTIVGKYEYDKDSDFQALEYGEGLKEKRAINLFGDNFAYISADRLGPQRYYAYSYRKLFDNNSVGNRGEYWASYLAEKGLTEIVSNKNVLIKEIESNVLIYQTQAWLSLISPGIMLQANKYKEAGIVGLQFDVSEGEFLPLNVGFGLSYVAPIIVALLKAKEGDLVIIENPEAHIHPKGQRMIGDLIARAASGGVQVLVETHSDHVLNGIRLAVKNKIIDRKKTRLNYFYSKQEKTELGVRNVHKKVSPMILDDGGLSSWPEGFFDEWDKAIEDLF